MPDAVSVGEHQLIHDLYDLILQSFLSLSDEELENTVLYRKCSSNIVARQENEPLYNS